MLCTIYEIFSAVVLLAAMFAKMYSYTWMIVAGRSHEPWVVWLVLFAVGNLYVAIYVCGS